jgi:hypothetical protein
MSYSDRTLEDLARSGLDETDAKLMRLEDLTASDVDELTKGTFRASGYRIPYNDRFGEKLDDDFRVRFHEPQARNNAKADKKQRYWQPKGMGVRAYLPRIYGKTWEKMIPNSKLLILVSEGEKKAAAAAKHKVPTIGLGGVDAISNKRRDETFLPELDELGSTGHAVRIIFDGDNQLNKAVRDAELRLGRQLALSGATVGTVQLPVNYALDSYLKKYGPDALLKLPVAPFDVRAQIEALRATEKPDGRKRNARVWSLMSADMDQRGKFHTVQNGEVKNLYYFDKDALKLYGLDDPKDRDTKAALSAHYGTNASEPEWAWLHEEIANHAVLHGTPTVVHAFASVDKEERALYVYDGNQGVFRITADGCTKEVNGIDGVLFRNPSMEPIEPAEGGTRAAVDVLISTPNFRDGQYLKVAQARMLYELWWWTPFFPELMPTRPILLLNGPPGSAKTSAAKRCIQTFFGLRADVTAVDPKRLDGLVATLSNDPVAVIDNADGAISGLENMLAVAATGGEYALRELYRTNQSRKIRLSAFIAATSRDPKPFRRDDIADRLLPLAVDRRESYVNEAQIDAETQRNRPAWWRYALDVLPKMLKGLCSFRPKAGKYRMADFARFCVAVGPALGYQREDIDAALAAVEQERNEFAAEGSTLPDALEATCRAFKESVVTRNLSKPEIRQRKDETREQWAERQARHAAAPNETDTWLTAAQLLETVKLHVDGFSYRNSTSFGMAIKNQEAALRIRGISIQRRIAHGTKQTYRVSWKDKDRGKK